MRLETIISQPSETLILLQQQSEMIELYAKEIKSLKEQIEWLKRQLFGRKSERFFNPDQLCFDFLIDAIENRPAAEPEAAKETRVDAHTRKVTPHGRGKLPEHLDRVIVEVDVPEEQKILPDGRERPRIGYDDSERLAYEPGRFYVHVTRRYKYGSPSNSEVEEGAGVIQAPLPETLLPRCLADDTLLAHVAVSKYGDHLPAYRLEQIFKRSGISISRQTLCGWMVPLGMALGPLVGAYKSELFKTGLIHNDDTRL